jgi:glycosyltransferase involved in cell wall biosynthesis
MAERRLDGVCFFGGYLEDYPRSGVLRKGLEHHGVRVASCRTSPKKKWIARYAALLIRYISMKRDFSIIFVPEFRHKDVPLAFVLSRLSGKRLVFDPLVSRYDTKIKDRKDAAEGSLQAWHNRNLDRVAFRLPDLVLADTRTHAEYFISEFHTGEDKVRVLPVGVDDGLFVAGRDSGGGKRHEKALRVLFFGNYLPLHGIGTIVSAGKSLKDEKDIRFELVGDGQTFSEVEAFVSREKLDNVRFFPRVPIEQLPERIAEADICLGIFGMTEKAGRVVANKVYQAMAMGKTVITADSSAIREFFVDGVHLCLVPSGDAGAIAEKIRYLSDNPDVRRQIGANAARLVHEKFDSRSIADMFLAYCREVMG